MQIMNFFIVDVYSTLCYIVLYNYFLSDLQHISYFEHQVLYTTMTIVAMCLASFCLCFCVAFYKSYINYLEG